LKRGILTPVLKKKKDKTLPGNYRGIVVTNTFSKIIESVIKERLEKQLSLTQNPLQRGFTEHASSKFTAFIAKVDSFAPWCIPCLISILSVVWSPHLTFRISPS
jgi:hypothetical protein